MKLQTMEHGKNTLIIAILLSLSGCIKQVDINSRAAISSQEEVALVFEHESNALASDGDASRALWPDEVLARLDDIPTMVGSTILSAQAPTSDSADYMLAWATIHEPVTVKNFYCWEMERLGWQRLAVIQGAESTLLFQKPDNLAVISIRPHARTAQEPYNAQIHVTVCPLFKSYTNVSIDNYAHF